MENTASILILISGFAHAVVNAILKAGADKMSRRALIDGFSTLFGAAIAVIVLKERLTELRFTGVLAIGLGAVVLIAAR